MNFVFHAALVFNPVTSHKEENNGIQKARAPSYSKAKSDHISVMMRKCSPVR